MRIERKLAIVVVVMATICGFSSASDAKEFLLRVSAKTDCVDVPVHTVIDLPEPLGNLPADEIEVKIRQIGRGGARIYGMPMPGQIVKGSDTKARLWWIMPRAEAGSANRWSATLRRREKEDKETFSWKDTEGQYLDLLFGGRKVTRYMYAYDTSTPQRVFETYKPLHHVFDAQGKNLLTNGPDGEHEYTKKIKFPHHRGIFIGWNRLEFGGKRFDLWHMSGVAQVHQKFLEKTAGPILARSSSLINWNDKGGEAMVAERREVTVFRQSEPTVLLLEFQSELKAVRGDVFLNGDPEHAGMQYRAHNDVATGGKDVKATYLFHKDGIDAHKDRDLPWAAMSCGLNGRRYSVLHMNHPDNPKQTLYSAYRDYGRFGAFFKKKVGAGETLKLRYRILVIEGEMPERGELAQKYSEFVDVPKVEVEK
ncbi:MAG: hypothetical protein GWN67_09300 [Phycisphaerae bacterium]|nr:hypothetical protein [Phycisphaerae bacterium]NIU08920.1 hypothetical protein [Phycisphaerae bacterium]NIU56561.1 hypothetical protein [Phycisphaerae bacterium]NIW93014.1 hypothetical protein [Phycisphaerae bacterium]